MLGPLKRTMLAAMKCALSINAILAGRCAARLPVRSEVRNLVVQGIKANESKGPIVLFVETLDKVLVFAAFTGSGKKTSGPAR